jgi:Tol biopolymer transport system component
MHRIAIGALSLSAALLLAPAPASAQFGQNKIAYEPFQWKVYPSPHFDVYYYGETEAVLEDVVSYAESAYLKLSRDLDHELRYRVPLVVYKTHADFEQTNITLSEVPEAVGAFAEPVQNRMVLPLDQPPDELYALIAHELTHIFQYSLFFEGYLGRALRASPPLWLMEGMASYLAQDETNLDRMAIRDAVVNNVLPPIQALDVLSFLTYRYGHAVFDFIAQEHGPEGLRTFLYEYRKVLLQNNVEKAIKESLGYDLDEFNRRFNRHLRRKYFPILLEKKNPEDYGKEIGIRKLGVFTFSPTLSPSGELVAALASPKMELDLVVLSPDDGSTVRNLTKGWTNRYRWLVAEAFDGKRDLSWSPAGDQIAVFVRKENLRPLLVYDALSGKVVAEHRLEGFAQCASPAFSPDGKRVAFEANRGGIVDVYEIELETGEIRNLTQDDFFDANPWYSADGTSILYNRRIGPHWKIFTVEVADSTRKTQLTFGPASDLQPSFSRDGSTVFFASDRGENGIFNIHALELASGAIRQYTDVIGGCFAPVEMAPRDDEPHLVFTSFFEGTFRLFRMPLRQPEGGLSPADAVSGDTTPFEPSLRLTTDPEKSEDYKLRWDIEAPSITVGVANDGTLLSDSSIQFTDLLGDHRFLVSATTVSSYANLYGAYINLKKRTRWGASVFDNRDYFVTANFAGDVTRDQIQRYTGATFFTHVPLNRHYRVEGEVGFIDTSQDAYLGFDPNTGPQYGSLNQRFATAEAAFVGDTTRYQFWGPFQGKRFRVSIAHGFDAGGDIDGDFHVYGLDFRAYKQLTARSLLAWRLSGVYNTGERESLIGFGGINELRGYEYREFFGSRVVFSNLEFRFPLIDEVRFPILSLRAVRGFFFLDAGGAWLGDDSWYDPESFAIRANVDALGRYTPVPFDAWDSENDRLQDVRGTYGFGLQFLFLGGLQFNWSWGNRLAYTRYVDGDPDPGVVRLEKTKGASGGRRMDFYIVFDF